MADPETFSWKPPFVRWRYWLPGASLAAGLTLLSLLICIALGNWGWGLWVGLPLSGGALVGYGVRLRWFGLGLLLVFLVVSIAVGLASMSLAGVFCGMAMSVIFLLPLGFGVFLGWLVRIVLKVSEFNQRAHLPMLMFFLIAPVWSLVEGPAREGAPETVTTARAIAAPVGTVWKSVVFFEDVRHAPPLLLRIGLARPLYTRGVAAAVGDTKVCVYNKGHITKQIVEVRTDALLAFEVIEQDIGYEHDVHLVGGSFAFEAIDPRSTRVTLATTYRPLLAPRFAWRPFEELAVHTLHDHVLDGMEWKARGEAPYARENVK